ncbi:hypothetical protein C3R30_22040, partial [Mycobacterium tuberculosis]
RSPLLAPCARWRPPPRCLRSAAVPRRSSAPVAPRALRAAPRPASRPPCPLGAVWPPPVPVPCPGGRCPVARPRGAGVG